MQPSSHQISSTLNSTKINLLVDGVIFAAFLAASAPHFTGMAIHEWLGIGFGALIVTHLLLHWSWLAATTRRIFTSAPRAARINFALNTLLFIAVTLIVFTGLMISETALPLLGLQTAPNMLWKRVHTLAADFAVLLVGLHIALHWGWITSAAKRYIVIPVAGALRLTGAPRPSHEEA